MAAPAHSYLRAQHTTQPPRLLITSPRARMPAAVVIAVAFLLVQQRDHFWSIALEDMPLLVALCALHAVWIPGRRRLWLQMTRDEWRVVHRRGVWDMLPGRAVTAAGCTGSLACAEVCAEPDGSGHYVQLNERKDGESARRPRATQLRLAAGSAPLSSLEQAWLASEVNAFLAQDSGASAGLPVAHAGGPAACGAPGEIPFVPPRSEDALRRPAGCAARLLHLRDGGFALRFPRPWELGHAYIATLSAIAALAFVPRVLPTALTEGGIPAGARVLWWTQLAVCAGWAWAAWARGRVCLRSDELRFGPQRWTLTQPRLQDHAWLWWLRGGAERGTVSGDVHAVVGAKVTSRAVCVPAATPYWTRRGVATGTLTLLLADGSELPLSLRAPHSVAHLQHFAAVISHHAPAARAAEDEAHLSPLADIDVQPCFEPRGAAALVATQAALLRHLSSVTGAAELAALPPVATRRVRIAADAGGAWTMEVAPGAPRPLAVRWYLIVFAVYTALQAALFAVGWLIAGGVSGCVVQPDGGVTQPYAVDFACIFELTGVAPLHSKDVPAELRQVLRQGLRASGMDPEWVEALLSTGLGGMTTEEVLAFQSLADLGERLVLYRALACAACVVAICVLHAWRAPRRARLVIDPRRGAWRLHVWRHSWGWLHRVPGASSHHSGRIGDLQGCAVVSQPRRSGGATTELQLVTARGSHTMSRARYESLSLREKVGAMQAVNTAVRSGAFGKGAG